MLSSHNPPLDITQPLAMPPANPRASVLDNPRASVLDVPSGSDSRSKLGIRPPTPKRPVTATPFHPPADTSTYRDLLLFEERLKMNAEMLRRRRRRYRIFLWAFILAFALSSYRLFTYPPENIVLLRGLQAIVAVVFITLALFFASGMHEEKIRYAHSYINHSNKALRPLNMYLNVRRPRTIRLPFLPETTNTPYKAQPKRRVSHSGGPSTVMAQIPPSTNPRGELIFSSRVDNHFEEGYKRYRAAFERRREERAREEMKAFPWWRRKRAPSPITVTPRVPTPRGPSPSPPASPRKPRRPRSRSPSPDTKEGRERAESYSFVYTGPGEAVSRAR